MTLKVFQLVNSYQIKVVLVLNHFKFVDELLKYDVIVVELYSFKSRVHFITLKIPKWKQANLVRYCYISKFNSFRNGHSILI